MRKVFSTEKYHESLAPYKDDFSISDIWTKECEGLTEEEMTERGWATHPSWMVEVHSSDCSVHNEPAYPNEPCDCGDQ